MLKVETLSDLLEQLEQVKSSLDHASGLLHDTGDFESEHLDDATAAIDKARTLVQSAHDNFNK